MTGGIVTIHIVSPAAIAREIALDCLTPEEIARAGRFRFEEDAIHWMACRSHLRMILGDAIQRPPREVPLAFSEFGKPVLTPPCQALHFNLSHCRDLAVIALTRDGTVGIDLEATTRAADLLQCESTFCHPIELNALPDEQTSRARQLLRIWTAKEAVLKAMGTGLSHPPESVRILFGRTVNSAISDRPLAGLENQNLHELRHTGLDGYQTFISVPNSVTRIQIV